MPASMRSVFSSRPMLWANCRTARGLRMATPQAGFRQLRKGLLLVAAGGFYGHQFDAVLAAEGGQLGDAFRVVGE